MLIFLFILWLVCFTFLVLYVSVLYLIIQQMRALHIEIRAGSPDEIMGIDRANLDEMTLEFESLGFERLGDLLMRNSRNAPQIAAPLSDPAVAPPLQPMRLQSHFLLRVLRHPHQGCQGIICSMVVTDVKGKRAPKATSWLAIASHQTGALQSWRYSTDNYQPIVAQDKITRACLGPRALWTRMSQATLSQLLEKHLERRQQIAQMAQIDWSPNPTLEDYVQGEQNWAQIAREGVVAQCELKRLMQ